MYQICTYVTCNFLGVHEHKLSVINAKSISDLL